jgi:hypothetical protein
VEALDRVEPCQRSWGTVKIAFNCSPLPQTYGHFTGALGVEVPLPCVLEGVDLRAGFRAIFFGEEDVIVLAGVEGRVEVDEIDGFVAQVALEDVEVVSVVELVFFRACCFAFDSAPALRLRSGQALRQQGRSSGAAS